MPPANVRSLLVVGHPRSGTGYMSQLLQAHGLCVEHEAMGADGISSWMFAAVTDEVPYSFDQSARSMFWFRHVIHVVRHPLKVISSTVFAVLPDPLVSDFMRRFVVLGSSGDEIEQVCRGYLGWNKLIDAQRPDLRVRVEEAAAVIPAFLRDREIGSSDGRAKDLPPLNYNTRPHRMLSVGEVRSAIPQELWRELVSYSSSLGYDFGCEG